MRLKETLNWRYSVKKYSDKKVSSEDLSAILDAINLSASSAGLQPYRVFTVKNSELRKELGEGSFNSQIAESSDLLVFAAYTSVTEEMISKYIEHIAEVRQMPVEQLSDFRKAMEGSFLSRTSEENFTWAARQAYIGLGTGIIAAAELKVDATPMEGFDSEKFDRLLGLKEKGLRSVVLLSLGYRDEEKDYLAYQKKVRLPLEEFAFEIA